MVLPENFLDYCVFYDCLILFHGLFQVISWWFYIPRKYRYHFKVELAGFTAVAVLPWLIALPVLLFIKANT